MQSSSGSGSVRRTLLWPPCEIRSCLRSCRYQASFSGLTRKENTGLSMIVFESEEAAQAASERIPGNVPEGVALEDVEVREVVAHA
jgi:hypothetical protein